ncbi:aldo/keto reductase [Deinococcus detaillensis]|uniref:Aldo/keto reductase n=1 Tax=Deinococcus detaillensis TaxID=2592048 RepID=A0A553V0Z0_9DEIO|nr:aldo/keto reductase [Deinococcus detaillensis]TSA86093.1 aldo/keto reductase [Deinococcus detaillensis]
MSAVLGYGLAAVGRPAYINVGHAADFAEGRSVGDLRQRTHTLLDATWEAGLRYFDAARSYGLAEVFLGEWLAAHPDRRGQLLIGSKWGYRYVGEWRMDAAQHEIKDHSLTTFEQQWPETLAALGGPPDLYFIHSVTPDSPALRDAALLKRLAQLGERGVTVGLSVSGPQQAQILQAALALGGPFGAAQATWNVLERSAEDTLSEAKAAGWRVVIKEALANGRLATPAPPALRDLAEQHASTPDALALAAALARPWADVVLSGASTRAQLESNLSAAQLIEADFSALETLREPAETYWQTRSQLRWN